MKKQTIHSDIILIDKPKGISSFDVIRKLRKKYGLRKMGHSGTLDPLATGLLIIGVGQGTKKLSRFIKLSKVYEADVLLGIKTETGDMEGKILEKKKTGNLNLGKIKKTLDSLKGKLILEVPKYSAVKISGQPLYRLSRKGKYFAAPKKEMEIFWIKLKDNFKQGDYYILKIKLKVKSGAYIRSIVEEIGRRLGWPAVVKELRRTKIGGFNISQAEKL